MSLFKLFERRSLENPAMPLTDAGLLSVLGGMPTDSGIAVTERTAATMAAVYRGVALISGLAGSLPLQVLDRATKKPVDNPLLDEPHPDMPIGEIGRLSAAHRCLWGNSYIQKVYNRRGAVKELWPIAPDRVTPGRIAPNPANPSGKVFAVVDDYGVTQPLTGREILHTSVWGIDPVCGISPVRMAAQAVGLALGAERYGAKLFGSGNLIAGLLTTDAKLTSSDAERLQRRWSERVSGLDNAHKVPVLDSGAKFQALTMPNDDAELLASRDFAVTELCRFMGIPPYLMFQTEKTTSWGCLPGDALVFTTSGPKAIEDVEPGEQVWSYSDGGMVPAKVTAWHMTGYKRLLTIRTATRELRVTANHRVPVRRYFGKADGRLPGNCRWETVEVSANEIKPGDHLLVPNGLHDGDRTVAPNGRELTVRAMELCGLYTGDGSADKNRVEIAHAVNDPHMPYYRESIRSEFDVEPYTDKRGTRSRFSSADARSLFECGFTGKAHTKRVPGWVFRLTEKLRLAFLRGYLDADGGIARGVVSFASCNQALLEDVRHLCISVGVPVGRVHLSRRGGVGYIKGEAHVSRDKFVLNLSMTELNHRIGSNHPAKLANLRTEPMRRKLRYSEGWEGGLGTTAKSKTPGSTPGGEWAHDDIRLQRVISIEHGRVEVPVYDITVDEHAHYVADGVVVHNTGLEQQSRGFTQFDMGPIWLSPHEARITKELLPKGQMARYDMSGLMRGDSIARAEYYRVMREIGAFSANDILDKEDLPPREGGDTYLDPVSDLVTNAPLGASKVMGGSSLGPSDSG